MPAPLPHGVTRVDTTTALAPPFTLGADTALVAISAGQAVCGLDIGFTDMDTGTSPTLAFDFGTSQGASDLASAVSATAATNVVVREGFTPIRYTADGSIWMTVSAVAVTEAAGSVILTHYTYPAAHRVNLRDRVLGKLGVLAAGESPSAADAARAAQALEDLHLRLEGLNLTAWGDAGISAAATTDQAETAFGQIIWTIDCVPRFAAPLYVIMAASDAADDFGLSEGRIGRLLQEAAGAERELRRLVRIPTNGTSVEAVYY